jgi:hypothetical protein
MKKLFVHSPVILVSFLMLLASPSFGQDKTLEGFVYEKQDGSKKGTALPGASLYWLGTTKGTTTNSDGAFKITIPDNTSARLIVSYVGYHTDTLEISGSGKKNIYLKRSVALNEVTIEGRKESTQISTIKTINTQQINQKELLKAACCNLSESFETNPSVNVSYADAITGAKEIQMLGLAGIYSQIMTENIPANRGLGGTYGLSYIPGPWMESIQITKGSGSVANGFESTTGQINVEYLKPETADTVYVNGYAASTGNTELNAHHKFRVSPKASTILMFHGENMKTKWDHQDDDFLDMPLMHNFNVFNRWSVTDGENYEMQFGVRAITERRRSGQSFYNYGDEADTTSGYGVQVKTNRIDAFSKTGLIFPATPWKSLGLILSGSYHDQNSYFGLKTYDGIQGSFYGSLIYMSIIGNTNHKWKAGLDFRHDDYNETYLLNAYDRTENVPGAYAEYTINLNDKFGAVAGGRADYHSEWGMFYTPRLHLKYNFTCDIILRASAGRSFRTSNVFADNISIMASSRSLRITEKLNPERAWNYGVNFTAKFTQFERPATFNIDYYVTEFSNQVIVDTYSSADDILIYNLDGDSYSRSFQVSLDYEAFENFDVRIAYKNDRVVMSYLGVPSQKPLVPEHKGLLNLAYNTPKENWRIDFTAQYHGETKLSYAITEELHPGHTETQVKNNTSPDYVTLLAQITHVFNRKWEVYLGGENLTNYRQESVVLNATDPFSPGFDATNIWGPVMGTKIYAGFRFKI